MIYNIAADLITKVDIAETFEIFANLKLYFPDGSLEGKKVNRNYACADIKFKKLDLFQESSILF